MRSKREDSKRRIQKASLEDWLGLALVAGYLGLFLAAEFLAYWIRFESNWLDALPLDSSLFTDIQGKKPPYLSHFSLGVFLFGFGGLYFRIFDRGELFRWRNAAQDIVLTNLFWVLFYLLLSLTFYIDPPISRVYAVLTVAIATPAQICWRAAIAAYVTRSNLAALLRKRVLVVGWNEDVQKIFENSITSPGALEFVGAIETGPHRFSMRPPVEILEVSPKKLEEGWLGVRKAIRESQCDVVLLADLNPSVQETTDLVNLCHRELVTFMAIPGYFDVLLSGLTLQSLQSVPVMTIGRLPLDYLSARLIKRFVDIIGALVGLAISLPVGLVVAVLIYRESPGPIFFAQERLGWKGRVFRMYKFRSMILGAEKSDHLKQSTTPDDDRLLKVGAIIRKWNIDELPQFWNVLKGDMSLVGPRPERVFHSNQLSEEITHYNLRLSVKPGMTGWAAVNGLRGDTDLTARVSFDIQYIERWSLPFDFYIMALTLLRNKNAV